MPPRTPDLAIPARYYARMGEMLMRQGIDISALLAPVGLTVGQLLRPDATLNMDQVDALVAQASQLTGRTDLGFELGQVLKLSSHSIVGFGMLSSPNLDYALRLAARFFPLIMPSFRMRYRCDGRHAEIVFLPTAPMSELSLAVHLEGIAVATHCEVRELLEGQMPHYELFLSIDEPVHVARYAKLSEARCHFGGEPSPMARLRFPASIASRPLALADPAAVKMAETRCNELVRSVVAQRKVGDWTRMMLTQSSYGMPSLAELAHTLNLSARTLDRHLQREGLRFRELVTQVRHRKACELLGSTTLAITQIAHELGYSDAANFTRAFRRQAQLSPSAYRQAQNSQSR